MSIYFDKRNGLMIDKPHQAKKLCPYCHINNGIKVECKFIEFNIFYCDKCDYTWNFSHNQRAKTRLIKQKNNEDSLFSIALRKNALNATGKNSTNQTKIPIKKPDTYQKSGIPKCPTCGAWEHTLVQDCPVFKGIKDIRNAEKSKRKNSATPAKQPETDLCPHCKAQVKAKKLPKHISEKCQVANRKQGQQTAHDQSSLIDNNNSINRPREERQEQPIDLSLCKQCNAKVRPENMQRHLFKVHGIKILKNHFTRGETNILFNNNAANNHRDSDWYECNNVDPIDGSKYLGYLRREYENSQFGSFPLHDDYGDESWAD